MHVERVSCFVVQNLWNLTAKVKSPIAAGHREGDITTWELDLDTTSTWRSIGCYTNEYDQRVPRVEVEMACTDFPRTRRSHSYTVLPLVVADRHTTLDSPALHHFPHAVAPSRVSLTRSAPPPTPRLAP